MASYAEQDITNVERPVRPLGVLWPAATINVCWSHYEVLGQDPLATHDADQRAQSSRVRTSLQRTYWPFRSHEGHWYCIGDLTGRR